MNRPLTSPGAKHAPAGKHHDGRGLYLVKLKPTSGKWVLRATIFGRRREMGLGRFPDVGIAEARRAADDARYVIRTGRDPISERAQVTATYRHLLRDIAEAAFETRKAELKDDGVAGRWMSPLNLHILPKLGALPVSQITQNDIAEVLKPLWHEKSVTATKALNRLGIVLNHAAAMGLEVDIQATKKARALLGKSRHQRKKIPAMDWRDVPEFYASLDDGSVSHLALRLLILTGLRSGPIRFARLDEMDGNIWTVPAKNMKSVKGRESDFRVPLAPLAMSVIEEATQHERDGYLFPSIRKGVLSDATMSRLMARRGLEARPHGFRSSLRTWIAECTDTPFDVAETVLAHQTLNSVQRAYQRSDHLERRMELTARWADFVSGVE